MHNFGIIKSRKSCECILFFREGQHRMLAELTPGSIQCMLSTAISVSTAPTGHHPCAFQEACSGRYYKQPRVIGEETEAQADVTGVALVN